MCFTKEVNDGLNERAEKILTFLQASMGSEFAADQISAAVGVHRQRIYKMLNWLEEGGYILSRSLPNRKRLVHCISDKPWVYKNMYRKAMARPYEHIRKEEVIYSKEDPRLAAFTGYATRPARKADRHEKYFMEFRAEQMKEIMRQHSTSIQRNGIASSFATLEMAA